MSGQAPPAAVTRSQIIAALRGIGVQAGAVIMLHVSVKAIGWIVGGPRVVLDALFDVLTPAGTLMMLASWEGNPYELKSWSVEDQRRWLAECPPFDPRTSPADHREMSILAEYLRTWQGARRSSHPLASFVAVGARAAWLTEYHALHYNHGADSPLARLCEAGGQVLLLGAPLSNMTLLHHTEHMVELPHKRIDRYRVPVLQNGVTAWVDIEEFDTTDGIADFGSDDYFLQIGREYLAAGQGSSGMVGAAAAHLFNAAQLHQFAMAWMQQHYRSPQA